MDSHHCIEKPSVAGYRLRDKLLFAILVFMTVRMRHTKGHTGNRRSHHALTGPRLSVCASCGSSHIRHQACPTCGNYRGRAVVNTKAVAERSLARKQAKLRARGENASAAGKEKTPADKDSQK